MINKTYRLPICIFLASVMYFGAACFSVYRKHDPKHLLFFMLGFTFISYFLQWTLAFILDSLFYKKEYLQKRNTAHTNLSLDEELDRDLSKAFFTPITIALLYYALAHFALVLFCILTSIKKGSIVEQNFSAAFASNAAIIFAVLFLNELIMGIVFFSIQWKRTKDIAFAAQENDMGHNPSLSASTQPERKNLNPPPSYQELFGDGNHINYDHKSNDCNTKTTESPPPPYWCAVKMLHKKQGTESGAYIASATEQFYPKSPDLECR